MNADSCMESKNIYKLVLQKPISLKQRLEEHTGGMIWVPVRKIVWSHCVARNKPKHFFKSILRTWQIMEMAKIKYFFTFNDFIEIIYFMPPS